MLMLAEFAFLGQGHIVVMFLTFVVPVWLGWWLRVCREERLTRLCFWLLAVALTANYFGIFLYRMSIGELTLRQALPMHLCDWVTIAVVVALVTRNRTAYELSYFWGLSGTLQAVITPNMQQNFPHPRCISFFVGHSGIVAAVLMLTLAASLRPHWRSVPKVLLWSAFYMSTAIGVNLLMNANYGFLMRKPAAASLLDWFSDTWWLYWVEIYAMALVFCVLLYLPFLLWDHSRERHVSAN